MADRKAWLLIYGGAFEVMLAVCVLAVATHPRALWQEAVNSARSLVDMSGNGPDRSVEAVPAVLGLFAVFPLLERILPAAGPRKPLRGYWLNFKVTLLEYITIPILGGLTSVAVIALGKRLGLGLIDLRFSTGHGMVDLILGFLLSTFIFDFFFYGITDSNTKAFCGKSTNSITWMSSSVPSIARAGLSP